MTKDSPANIKRLIAVLRSPEHEDTSIEEIMVAVAHSVNDKDLEGSMSDMLAVCETMKTEDLHINLG